MAAASMNDIKSRIKSVSGTMQITKAMELVATSKLRRAREKVEASRPFHEMLGRAIDAIESSPEVKDSVWSKKASGGKTLFVAIAGDRGLAGGYNANVFRLAASLAGDGEALYLPIGKKATDYYNHRKMNVFANAQYVSEVSVGGALALAEKICEGYLAGEFDKVVIVYTKFVSMISQIPVHKEILPLDRTSEGTDTPSDPIFCGDPEELLDKIVPEYVGGILYSAICEALASESGARRTAMNAANKNAAEMIDELMLKYNRARQSVITQEITEIVSGSEAL